MQGFKELANLYLRATPPSVETLKKAGYTVSKAGDGKTWLVVINGAEYSLESAAKAGLI